MSTALMIVGEINIIASTFDPVTGIRRNRMGNNGCSSISSGRTVAFVGLQKKKM